MRKNKWIIFLLIGRVLTTSHAAAESGEKPHTEAGISQKERNDTQMHRLLFDEETTGQKQKIKKDKEAIPLALDRFVKSISIFENEKIAGNGAWKQLVTTMKGVDDNPYYNIDLYDGSRYIGYVIVGEHDGRLMVAEYGTTPSPVQKAHQMKTLSSPEILYGGPLLSYVVDVDQNTEAYDTQATNIITGDIVQTDSLLFETANSSSNAELITSSALSATAATSTATTAATTAVTTQPSPPSSGYTQISFTSSTVFHSDVQGSLGIIPSLYGCGPAAGTNLLYSLAERNSSYNNMLWWTSDPERPIDMSLMGSILVTDMSAIGGTTFGEFKSGLNNYLDNYNHNPTLMSQLRSDNTSLGTPTTTSNLVVWSNIQAGINGNKPVAVLAGSRTSSGNSYYPDTGSTYNMEFHWFTALGYIQDADANMYLKVSSWGNIYYISYNALCYWRDTLGSVYINASY